MLSSMTDFYTQLADDYDSMTRFDSRLASMQATLANLVTEYGIHKALDVACGTGIATIALGRLGLEVTGTDLNSDMIEAARKNATTFDTPQITFYAAGMGDSFEGMKNDYDAVFCIGNSIPHVLEKEDFKCICKHFYRILKPGGLVVIQLKNFEMLTKERKRFVGAHRCGDREYIRFYDFNDETVVFNILRIDWQDDVAVKQDLIETTLRPYERSDFEAAMEEFEQLTFCSTLKLEPFDPNASGDLVVVATK